MPHGPAPQSILSTISLTISASTTVEEFMSALKKQGLPQYAQASEFKPFTSDILIPPSNSFYSVVVSPSPINQPGPSQAGPVVPNCKWEPTDSTTTIAGAGLCNNAILYYHTHRAYCD